MAFEFKIQLVGINKPPVYRKLKVPENMTFEKFHESIQICFDWYNCHLYSFSERGYGSDFQIEIPGGMSQENSLNAGKVKLKEIFNHEKQTFIYIYDFGDDWTHTIILEKITTEKISRPSCTGGKGKCPPEDCGGIDGYRWFLKVIKNPNDSEYEEMREWACLEKGEEWDVQEFDMDEVNEILLDEF